MSKKVVAIVGSYRKGGTIDSAVQAILAGAREKGAETHTIYLADRHIELCTNCRECVQKPGPERGKCKQQDDLEPMLMEIEAADALVLGSSVNYYNVTALFRKFLERLICYTYWPWGQNGPRPRSKRQSRKSVLVASSGMPGFLIPIFTGAAKALRLASVSLGAKPVSSLWIGLAAGAPHYALPARVRERARRIGWKLA
jgi:NAD(P)H-dependent FMN reductase